MTILVIGGPGGMVAGALAQHPGVVALGRPDADLTQPETLARAVEAHAPSAVICAGAFTRVDDAEFTPDEAIRINADGPGALATICAAHNVPLIHISTDYVFDGAKADPYVETDKPAPINAYGQSKFAGEEAVRAAGGVHVIVRTSWVHAPTGRNFLRTMLQLAETRDRIGVVDDQWGSPTYANHLAIALLRIAETLPANPSLGGIYHVAGAGEATWRAFADVVFEEARKWGLPFAQVDAIASADFPIPATRPLNSRLDTRKAHDTFGLALPHWRSGVAACVSEIYKQKRRVD